MVIGEFNDSYPPMVDGVGHVTQAYCIGLEKLGHQTYYIAPDDSNETRIDGLDTVLYGGIPLKGMPYKIGIPPISIDYLRFSSKTKFDIIHSHTPLISGMAAKKIAKKQEIALVSTFHSKYRDDFLKTTHSRAFADFITNEIIKFYNICDEVWVPNESTKETLKSYGFKGPIIVMPNGTDNYELTDEDYKKSLSGIKIRKNVPVLLFVGQVDCKKNLEYLIEACRILNEKKTDFELLIAGQGPDEKLLSGLCKIYKIENKVHFLGFINDEKILRSLYKRADLFILPSLYDTFSLVVREAASMKTPSLLIRGSNAAECITDKVNGFLCSNSPESIAEEIVNALPSVRSVGEKAYETIPIPWNTIMKQVEERYIRLCESKGSLKSKKSTVSYLSAK